MASIFSYSGMHKNVLGYAVEMDAKNFCDQFYSKTSNRARKPSSSDISRSVKSKKKNRFKRK